MPLCVHQRTAQPRHGLPFSHGVVHHATQYLIRFLYMLALSSYEHTDAIPPTYRHPVRSAAQCRYYPCRNCRVVKVPSLLTSSARITSRCLRRCTTLLRSLQPRHAAWMRTTAASRAARAGPAR